jgi:phosphate transport system substrate-binding protein
MNFGKINNEAKELIREFTPQKAKIIFMLAVLAMGSLCFNGSFALKEVFAEESKILAAGCVTEYNIMRDLVNIFNSDKLAVKLAKTGNMKAFKLFLNDKIDFVFISSPPKMLAQKMGIPEEKIQHIKSIEIATEPIIVVVDSKAGVNKLTKDQIIDIYNNKIVNWSEVGGQNMKIFPLVMQKSLESGLAASFRKLTIGMMNSFEGEPIEVNGPFAINNFLKNKKGGIGYVGYSSLSQIDSKTIIIDGVEPSMKNFTNGSYPFVAKYYLAYNKETPPSVQSFIDFVKSPTGGDIINQKAIASSF